MLAHFPHPYPDELLYSVLARYHIRSGNQSPKMTLLDVFGVSSITAVVDLPSNIDNLVANLPIGSKYTSEYLIYNHTLYPYYAPFLPLERAQAVLSSMQKDNGGAIHTSIGIMASTVPSTSYLRFCPLCQDRDIIQYGESYWHRAHNLPGVLVCSEHGISLVDSCIPIHKDNRHTFIAANKDNCLQSQAPILAKGDNLELLYKVAQESQWLLNNDCASQGLEYFQDKYLADISSRGLVSLRRRFVDQRTLAEQFLSFYDQNTLQLLNSVVDYNRESDWLKAIVRKQRKAFHPLRHILMSIFLFGEIKELFKGIIKYSPFGVAPWPCLNAGAHHYMDDVVSDMIISTCSDTGRPVGTFLCECGFVYSRRGPDENLEDRYKIGRIKSFGHVWEAKLTEVIGEKLSLRETARRLRVDPSTVKRYASMLGLSTTWKVKSNEGSSSPTKEEKEKSNSSIEAYRQSWVDLQRQNPSQSRTKLRLLNTKVYAWLYRNDRDWLFANSPKLKRTKKPSQRVDWKLRDEIILGEIEVIVEKLMNCVGKPERISLSKVGKMTKHYALIEKHLSKLPRTKAYFESVTETVEQFQSRRISWVVRQLSKTHQHVMAWEVYRIAGIRFSSSFSSIHRKIFNEICQLS